MNIDALKSNWTRAWSTLDTAQMQPMLGDQLLARWAESHRHYHSLQHLDECLATFERVSFLATRPVEVALALWFHDAIYDVKASDNEARSAAWARQALHDAGAPADCVERVHSLVMATRHDVTPSDPDQQLLVDIDLSILGASPERFAQYEKQVRAEYSFVPDDAFRTGRRAILQSFLARPHIYNTSHFQASHEVQARRNLRLSLAALA